MLDRTIQSLPARAVMWSMAICSGWPQCHSYPVTPLFDIVRAPTRPWPAGLILGYVSLTIEQIQQGILTLASVIAKMGSS
jgi:hypothetical protein